MLVTCSGTLSAVHSNWLNLMDQSIPGYWGYGLFALIARLDRMRLMAAPTYLINYYRMANFPVSQFRYPGLCIRYFISTFYAIFPFQLAGGRKEVSFPTLLLWYLIVISFHRLMEKEDPRSGLGPAHWLSYASHASKNWHIIADIKSRLNAETLGHQVKISLQTPHTVTCDWVTCVTGFGMLGLHVVSKSGPGC